MTNADIDLIASALKHAEEAARIIKDEFSTGPESDEEYNDEIRHVKEAKQAFERVRARLQRIGDIR